MIKSYIFLFLTFETSAKSKKKKGGEGKEISFFV
jgi:hypothetical protein